MFEKKIAIVLTLILILTFFFSGCFSKVRIFHAVGEGQISVVKKLLDKDPSLVNLQNENDVTPLQLAVANGDKKMVELLVEKGADINIQMDKGATALHAASFEGDKEIVELLIEKEAELNI